VNHRGRGHRITAMAALRAVACLGALASIHSCGGDPASPPQSELRAEARGHDYAVFDADVELFTLEVAKWPGGRAAAVSITYDAAWGTHVDHHLATDAAIARGLRMDLEMVTCIFTEPRWTPMLGVYREELLPNGIRFFGHGHTHALHDTMDYEGAYESFHTCFELMQAWGFRPRAYAYPGSSGHLLSTQRANRDAGFICARGSTADVAACHLLAGDNPRPPNWYYLPSLGVGEGSYRYPQNHDQLAPILNQALDLGSWIILMYHAIGIPECWGYYPFEEFAQDLDQIAAGDFWCANLDQAAAYVQERTELAVDLQPQAGPGRAYQLSFSDGLPDETFDEPLTVTFRFSGLSAASLRVDPPVGTGETIAVRGDSARVQLVPAEAPALLVFE